MAFFLLGIDHNTVSVDIREAVYWKRAEFAEFWKNYTTCRIAIFSTCNRLEIYGIVKNASEAREAVNIFKKRFGEYFAHSYIIYGEKNVFEHLARLAAGLESQIKGELQIFSQLGAWAGKEDFPQRLGRIVREALLAGFDIRANAGLNRPENNIAVMLYKKLLERNRSDDLLNVAVAGTGKIAELFARYKPQEVRLYFAARKNILKAQELARLSQGTALLLKELPALLLNADALVSATSSPHRVFDKNYFLKIAALREKQLYVYDLAVPRDVEPDVKKIDGIVLKNIDEVISDDSDIKNRDTAKQVSR